MNRVARHLLFSFILLFCAFALLSCQSRPEPAENSVQAAPANANTPAPQKTPTLTAKHWLATAQKGISQDSLTLENWMLSLENAAEKLPAAEKKRLAAGWVEWALNTVNPALRYFLANHNQVWLGENFPQPEITGKVLRPGDKPQFWIPTRETDLYSDSKLMVARLSLQEDSNGIQASFPESDTLELRREIVGNGKGLFLFSPQGLDEPGIYRLTLASEYTVSEYYVQVSQLLLHAVADQEKIWAWASFTKDPEAKQPPFEYLALQTDGKWLRGQTNEQGFKEFDLKQGRIALILMRAGEHWAVNEAGQQNPGNPLTARIYSDAQHYSPGQPVQFYGFVRETGAQQLPEIPSAEQAQISIYDGQNQLVLQKSVNIDSWGQFALTYTPEKESPAGLWRAKVSSLQIDGKETEVVPHLFSFLVQSESVIRENTSNWIERSQQMPVSVDQVTSNGTREPDLPLLSLKPKQTLYSTEENAVITIHSERDSVEAWVYINGQHLFFQRFGTLTRGDQDIVIPVRNLHRGYNTVSVRYAGQEGWVESRAEVLRIDPARIMHLSGAPDTLYHPGDTLRTSWQLSLPGSLPANAAVRVSLLTTGTTTDSEDSLRLPREIYADFHGFHTQFFPAAWHPDWLHWNNGYRTQMLPGAWTTAGQNQKRSLPKSSHTPENEPDRFISPLPDTVWWSQTLRTNAEGIITAEIPLPDEIRNWTLKLTGSDNHSAFVSTEQKFATRQNLLVHIRGPRAWMAGDSGTVEQFVHNGSNDSLQVHLRWFELQGKYSEISRSFGSDDKPDTTLVVLMPPKTRRSFTKKVTVEQSDSLWLRLEARAVRIKDFIPTPEIDPQTSPLYTDAEMKGFAVHSPGIPEHKGFSGIKQFLGPGETLNLKVPAEGGQAPASLKVCAAPSLYLCMQSAFDDLHVEGGAEEVLYRFLPGMLLWKQLSNDSLPPAGDMRMRLQELVNRTQISLDDLAERQNTDGGWGWQKSDSSEYQITTRIVQGLNMALQTQVLPGDLQKQALSLQRNAQEFLQRYLDYVVEIDKNAQSQTKSASQGQRGIAPRINEEVRLLHSLIQSATLYSSGSPKEMEIYARMYGAHFAWLYSRRSQLGSIEWAMLLELSNWLGFFGERQRLLEDLEQRVIRKNGMVYWKSNGQEAVPADNVEVTARTVQSLLRVKPSHSWVHQTLPWLLSKRRGSSWSNIRSTGEALTTLMHLGLLRGEDESEYSMRLEITPAQVQTVRITPENMKETRLYLELQDSLALNTSQIPLQIKGEIGTIYYSVERTLTRTDNLDKGMQAKNSPVTITREYHLIDIRTRRDGEREVARSSMPTQLQPGDRIEGIIRLKVKKDMQQVMVQDFFPQGLRYIHAPNDWFRRWFGKPSSPYSELRTTEQGIVWLIDQLPRGEYEFHYLLEAEYPGVYQAAPARIHEARSPQALSHTKLKKIRIAPAGLN